MNLLEEAAIFLGAAVIAVPIMTRLGLGSVIGFIVAGALIGPSGFGLIAEVESTLHFAELGVVFLLFLIGLELQPSRLWAMRGVVFGLGSLQMAGTTAALSLVMILSGFDWKPALVLALALSLSSTAFALQVLAERSELAAPHGRAGFGVLLFQDLMVIPILAILPVLADPSAALSESTPDDTWYRASQAAAVLIGLLVVGRFLIRPLLSFTVSARAQEVSTAAALLVVVGTAIAVESAGLSMALGAFMAGVLLAESEFRHELEANVAPFKGLLLGLFFMSVGMATRPAAALERPFQLAALVLVLLAVKATVLFAVGSTARRWSQLGQLRSRFAFAIVLSQGGEFAFVILREALEGHIVSHAMHDLVVLAVTLSMMTTPLLIRLVDGETRSGESNRPHDAIEGEAGRVILAGFGRYGQIVARVLRMKRIPFTALEADATQVDFVRRFGNKIFYGDASRVEMLRAAGAEEAEVFVLAVGEVENSVKIAETVRTHFPHLPVFARARDRDHAHVLHALGARVIHRETFFSSLRTAEDVLQALGLTGAEAGQAVRVFKQHDEKVLDEQFEMRGDQSALVSHARRANAELEELFDQDKASLV
ncbi:MAG: monovalent cation:proton antiporter-2 (CPA2) family protein [Myxococcota bacterium]